jgi:hypothetical protein
MNIQQIFFPYFLILMILLPVSGMTQTNQLETNGWRITVDPEKEVISIDYDHLGIVLDSIRLQAKQDNNWIKLTNWRIEKEDHRIHIHTENPSTDWTFYIRNRVLGIISSVEEGQFIATAPAGRNRFPARMIDYSGHAEPVAWKGTTEIEYSYGGNQTKNLSFLPAENPEVMYLSLGQVSGLNMHCLFDKFTDTMIRFNDQTEMIRVENDKMEITVPVDSHMEAITVYRDYYTKHLGLPVYQPMVDDQFDRPPVLWNSWTNYYYLVTENEIVKNVDWIVDNFNDYGVEFVVIDDGPERGEQGEHYWTYNWNRETFPHGPEWLVDYIKSKGLKAGLWVVPNSYAGAFEDHPEWYLQNKDGDPIMVYNSPSLDCTNPEVLDFLTRMFTTLREWGFEYYKFDGEFALTEYIPNIDRSKLYDQDMSPLQAYRNRLKVIREATGESTFIEGCPSGTPLQGIGYFNSYFNGDDIYNSWLGMYPFFLSINANLFLNNVTTYLMPGEGICVAPKMDIEEAEKIYNPEFIRVAASRETDIQRVGTTMEEARTIVTYASLSGTPYSFADRLPDLPEDRIDLLKKSLPTMPIVPMDLFSRGGYSSWDLWEEFTPENYEHNFPRILDLKVNAASGVYDVIAVTNWSNRSDTRSLSFGKKLGLDPQDSFLVFDFWNEELLGVYNESIKIDIEPHDTRVLHIRSDIERPQLIGTNRHISGAYSIKSLAWDASEHILKGSSVTVKNWPYTLFLHIPDKFSFSEINSNGKVLSTEESDRLLKVVIEGQEETVNWLIKFKKTEF